MYPGLRWIVSLAAATLHRAMREGKLNYVALAHLILGSLHYLRAYACNAKKPYVYIGRLGNDPLV